MMTRLAMPLLLLAVVCMEAVAGSTYDDRAVIAETLQAATELRRIMPDRHGVKAAPRAFSGRELVRGTGSIRRALGELRAAQRRRGVPEELAQQRSALVAALAKFLAEYTSYKVVYGQVASAERELDRLRRAKPPRSSRARFNAWVDRYGAVVNRNNPRIAKMNKQHPVARRALNDLIAKLRVARTKVASLYEAGAVRPLELGPRPVPAGKRAPPDDGPVEDPLTGSVEDMLARSACDARELRRAMAGEDRPALDALADKTVVIRAMLVTPPKVEEREEKQDNEESEEKEEKSAVAVVAAGGGSVSVDFPPDTEASELAMGVSLVIAGTVREVEGEWRLRAVAWGVTRDLSEGGQPVRCEWDEEAAPAEDPEGDADGREEE